MGKGKTRPPIEFVPVSTAFLGFTVHHASSNRACLKPALPRPKREVVFIGVEKRAPSGTAMCEKGDKDRASLPLARVGIRHRRKPKNTVKS